MSPPSPDKKAYGWGIAGVVIFSLTLPATRATVGSLDPLFVGLGRGAVAAFPALAVLLWVRPAFPSRKAWPHLALVALGVVIGFPCATAIALQRVPAAHGTVVVGLLPLAAAAAAAWLSAERMRPRFWLASVLGSGAVVAFSLRQGAGSLQPADAWLLAAVAAAALGYVEGARLARSLGGWQVICWALVLALPLTLGAAWGRRPPDFAAIPFNAWLGFAYVSFFSMFLGYVVWYRALALGGVARMGQLQLLQPFITLAFCALLLRERFEWTALAAVAWVVACVAWERAG